MPVVLSFRYTFPLLFESRTLGHVSFTRALVPLLILGFRCKGPYVLPQGIVRTAAGLLVHHHVHMVEEGIGGMRGRRRGDGCGNRFRTGASREAPVEGLATPTRRRWTR
ncbi:hypothetical protein GCM10010360_39440 [Streptomyces nogalater]